MGKDRRALQIRHQRKTEAKRRRVRVARPDLNSLVAPHDPAEESCQRGTNRWNGRGIENTQQYVWLLASHGRFEDALKLCDAALTRYPRHAGIADTRQDVLLLSGDLSAPVWRDRYRSRRQCPFRQPKWIGDPQPGSTIFIWEEDNPRTWFGLGDCTMFVRLVALVKAQSQARVIAGVPRGMTRLFSSVSGADVLVEPPWPEDGFDFQCQWSAIPALPGCELSAEWLVRSVPYLFAETEAVERWADTFADRSLVHVGLHWNADPSHQDPKQLRSVPLEALAPLFSLEGVRFYSLQYNGSDELKAFPQVVDLGNVDQPGERFVQSAAIMTHLDLMIGCDSGPEHVGGAIGLKVWLLLGLAAQDPRWGLKHDTPWYPKHRLLHQQPSRDLKDWDGLVGDMRDVLESDIKHGVYRRT